MYKDLHIYIDFNWNEYSTDYDNYFPKLYEIVELAYQHKATVFYSEHQAQELKLHENLDKNFSQSHGNRISVLLRNGIKKSKNSYLFDVCFSDEHTSFNYVDDPVISIISPHSNNALISVSKNNCKPLLSIKSDTEFESVNFVVINETDKLLKWIQNNSSTRNFNLSNKHGENGCGNWLGESVLLCSEYEAQQLLETAIPDFYEKEKQLFNFDNTHQTFIEFFWEGDNPQNKWHGFHISEDKWAKRIPNSIRKHFGK